MRIMLGSEYKKINKAICEIKNKYPNVVTLLEDGEKTKLNDEEENAIIEILKLQEEINMIELKESFKLGFKEAYIYFESMDMLKIQKEDTMGERIKCKKCGDILQSKYRHDFQMCKCGSCYRDGGDDYCRVGGKKEDIEWLDRKEKNKKKG